MPTPESNATDARLIEMRNHYARQQEQSYTLELELLPTPNTGGANCQSLAKIVRVVVVAKWTGTSWIPEIRDFAGDIVESFENLDVPLEPYTTAEGALADGLRFYLDDARDQVIDHLTPHGSPDDQRGRR